jgi:hypothetical protein
MDQRFAFGCAVVDNHVRLAQTGGDKTQGDELIDQAPRHAEADTVGRVLRQCPEDPITFTTLSDHLAYLRKGSSTEKARLLHRLVALDLGCVTEGRLIAGTQERAVIFHRSELTTARRKLLQELRVPESSWRPSSSAASAAQSSADIPSMSGAGRPPPLIATWLHAVILNSNINISQCRARSWKLATRITPGMPNPGFRRQVLSNTCRHAGSKCQHAEPYRSIT